MRASSRPQRRSSSSARTAGLAALFLLLGALSPAVGSAAVRLLSPHDDQLIGRGAGSVSVRVEASRTGKVYGMLELTGKPKGTRVKLHRVGAELRGRIPRKVLRVGRDHLFIYSSATGKLVASAHFTVGRVRSGMLRLSKLGPRARSAIEVHARVRKGAVFQATLNGRRVTTFDRRGSRLSASLSADDGLRFGYNRLAATSFDRQSGDYRSVVRKFRIARDSPLVGAGPDLTATTGRKIRLDGSSSRAGRGRLALHWRIADSPRGSHAHLVGGDSRRPWLVGATPGEYTMALTATQRSGGSTEGARSSAALPGVTDKVKRCVQPDVLPEGIPIVTFPQGSAPLVKVGSTAYPMPDPASNFVQVLILDRCTLEEVSNTSYGNTKAELETLARTLGQESNEQIVVVSGGGGQTLSGTEFQSAERELIDAVGEIGGEFGEGFANYDGLDAGRFSVIGVPGMRGGEAGQVIGGSIANGAPEGLISGVLQLDAKENFTFNWPPTGVPFELGEGTAGGGTTIVIGGHQYVEPTIGEAGFHMVWVDPKNLDELGQETAPVTEIGLSALQTRLNIALEEEALVFISSYGKPNLRQPGNSGFNNVLSQLAQTLRGFGSNPYAFLGLQGQSSYSFIGLGGANNSRGPNSGTELVQTEAGTKTNWITGELRRSLQGVWMPTNNASPLGTEALIGTPLTKILQQPKQGFKPLSKAVQEYIYEKKFATESEPKMDPTFGLRRLYWESGGPNGSEFGKLASSLRGLAPCQSQPCAAEFSAVQATLVREFEEVSDVKEFFEGSEKGDIHRILSEATLDTNTKFTGVKEKIVSLYESPKGEPKGDSEKVFGVYSGVLTLSQGLAGVDPATEPVADSLAVIQGLSEVAYAFGKNESGQSVYTPNLFQAEVLDWADRLTETLRNGFAGLELSSNLFVSDEGRLQAVYELVKTKGKNGGLKFSRDEETDIRVGIERSIERVLWETMLPVAVQAAAPFTGPFKSPLGSGPASSEGVYEVNVPVGKGPNATILYGYDIAPYQLSNGFRLPTPATAKLLFGTPEGEGLSSSGPVGFRPKYFLTPSAGGFSTGHVCQQETSHNYEVQEVEEVKYPRGEGGYYQYYVPCTEAEPPFSHHFNTHQEGF